MDKSNEIELLQAQLIQERALVQDLEAGKSKMILDAIEVGGQFSDLREAVRVLKEVLQFVMLKAPGYDWNTDPLSITLMVGNAFTKSNHVLAGEPDEENDSLQAQLTQRTGQIAALQARVQELEEWKRIVTGAGTDQESVIRLAATEYTKTAVQCWKEANAKVESQLTQRTAELEAAQRERGEAAKDRDDWITSWRALQRHNERIEAELERVRGELAKMRERKDGAYLERNCVVAALATCFPSGVARTAIEGWDEEWHGCVYIDLPVGQVSWHYHDSHAHLFAHLPAYTKPWDGHTTEEKYERVAMLQHRQGMEG